MEGSASEDDGIVVQGCLCGAKRHRFFFDEFAHVYLLDGKAIPGASELGARNGLTREFNDAAKLAAERGTNVHQYFKLHDTGEIGQYQLDEAAERHLAEWKAFQSAFGIERFEAIEQPWFTWIDLSRFAGDGEGVHIAGTCDRVYRADPKHPLFAGRRVLCDAKTSHARPPEPNKWYRAQTAIYKRIFGCEAREIVYTHGDGQQFDGRAVKEGGSVWWPTSTFDDEMVDHWALNHLWRKSG